jgi:hypothetical protein
MRHHFRHPQAMFNKGSLFYNHCESSCRGKGKDYASVVVFVHLCFVMMCFMYFFNYYYFFCRLNVQNKV